MVNVRRLERTTPTDDLIVPDEGLTDTAIYGNRMRNDLYFTFGRPDSPHEGEGDPPLDDADIETEIAGPGIDNDYGTEPAEVDMNDGNGFDPDNNDSGAIGFDMYDFPDDYPLDDNACEQPTDLEEVARNPSSSLGQALQNVLDRLERAVDV